MKFPLCSDRDLKTRVLEPVLHLSNILIRGLFNLTDEQINVVLTYIETNRAEVEAEYQIVLKEAEELRQYYQERNRDLIARLATKPLLAMTE